MLHDEPRRRIAAEVRAEMARQQKLQSELATLLNLPQQSVSKRLLGRTSFRAEELALIAGWLVVPVDRFLSNGVAA